MSSRGDITMGKFIASLIADFSSKPKNIQERKIKGLIQKKREYTVSTININDKVNNVNNVNLSR